MHRVISEGAVAEAARLFSSFSSSSATPSLSAEQSATEAAGSGQKIPVGGPASGLEIPMGGTGMETVPPGGTDEIPEGGAAIPAGCLWLPDPESARVLRRGLELIDTGAISVWATSGDAGGGPLAGKGDAGGGDWAASGDTRGGERGDTGGVSGGLVAVGRALAAAGKFGAKAGGVEFGGKVAAFGGSLAAFGGKFGAAEFSFREVSAQYVEYLAWPRDVDTGKRAGFPGKDLWVADGEKSVYARWGKRET